MNRLWRHLGRARESEPRQLSASSAADWRATMARRVGVAAGVFVVWAVAIEAKLVYLQVFQHAEFQERAREQQQQVTVEPAMRGDIVDRYGQILATSADADSIFAVPSEIDDPAAAVDKLCGALADCTKADRETLLKRFSAKSSFAYVRRQASVEQARSVAKLGLAYVSTRTESRRFYPNKELAAHLLGWVGTDNDGLGGIEFAYNKQIKGEDGQALIQTDAKGRVFSRVEQPPTEGASLELTIDKTLQHVAERELHAGVLEHDAAGGTAIIMNPRTGEILALANEPTFDPNTARDPADPRLRNRAVQDRYEPGSTFKLVTASAAIQEQVVPLDAPIDTSPGLIRVGSAVYHDTSNHGVLSFADVIADSSNVGAIRIGLKVGVERLSKYVTAYGFGRRVSPDFPGESSGKVWPADTWTDLTLASVSIGYQVDVTPLQMLAAVSAIANGGAYVEPRAVRALSRGNRRIVVRPNVLRQTISAETAATLTGIMEAVVEEGTGRSARIPGFTVAGKTGTARKVIDGHYSSSWYNASFVGFAPSSDPAIAIIIVIDSPRVKGYYGGTVSAPIFQRIAVSALRHLAIAPTVNPAPPVILPRAADRPRAASSAPSRAPTVRLVTHGPGGEVPDLRGMSARDANTQLAQRGLRARMSGDGFVVSQHPAPGTPIEVGAVCQLVLTRAAGVPAGGGTRP